MLESAPRMATVKARTDTRLVAIEKTRTRRIDAP